MLGDVSKVRSEQRLVADGLDDLGMCVPDQHGAPTNREIHKASAITIPKLTTLAIGDNHGQLGWQIEFAVGAGGENCK